MQITTRERNSNIDFHVAARKRHVRVHFSALNIKTNKQKLQSLLTVYSPHSRVAYAIDHHFHLDVIITILQYGWLSVCLRCVCRCCKCCNRRFGQWKGGCARFRFFNTNQSSRKYPKSMQCIHSYPYSIISAVLCVFIKPIILSLRLFWFQSKMLARVRHNGCIFLLSVCVGIWPEYCTHDRLTWIWQQDLCEYMDVMDAACDDVLLGPVIAGVLCCMYI